jgi:excisionase family DNA binding protein
MRLLTDSEAQALLRVSRTTLWRLRKSEALPFLRVGGEIRYRGEDLEQWLEGQPADARDAPPSDIDPPKSRREMRWKEALEAEDWAFHEEATNTLTHALHPYPAKFPPALPARLMEILAADGDVVFDPFCGCGTALVEARRLGLRSVGSDINPVAVLASRAKTVILDDLDLEVLAKLGADVERTAAVEAGEAPLFRDVDAIQEPLQPPEIPNLEKWFSPVAIRELGGLRGRIATLEIANARLVAEAVFSAIIVAASNQDSETRYTARQKGLTAGDVLTRFGRKLADALRMHHAWRQTAGDATPKVLLADARDLPAQTIGQVDLVVTSPPYANAFDYHLYHRHRLYWLGHSPSALRSQEIGSHLNHQREGSGIEDYRQDMRLALQSIRNCLRPGGACVIVVGDSVFHGRTIDNGFLLATEARKAGYRFISSALRRIHPVKRSVIGVARRAKVERILLLVRED